jgi:hypothetical protein
MGWIYKRCAETGGSIGGRRKGRVYPKDGAPLRKIVGVILRHGNLFQADIVLLECGHEGRSWGGVRARCPACKKPQTGDPQ